MHRIIARVLLGSLAPAAWLAACQTLPPTEPLVFAGRAGAPTGGASGNANTGGTAGSTGGSSSGGAPAGGSAGTRAGSGGLAQGGTAGSGEGGSDDGGADSGGNLNGGSAGKGGGSGSGGSSGKGGSAGKAGSGGAGAGGRIISNDPDTFFGDSRCTPDLHFCEDFEDASLNTERWQIQATNQAPTVETVRPARGLRSAHFHTEDNGLSLLHTTEPFPMPNNRYYGRMFVWFDSMPTAPAWAHWTIATSGTNADESEIRVGGQFDNTINRFGVGTNYGPTGDWTNLDEDPGDPVPVRTWVCVEWLHDSENDVTDFWWNGILRPSLHTTATDHGGQMGEYTIPDIDKMFVGFWHYQSMTVPDHFDVWIDEVAIDSERIGCNN